MGKIATILSLIETVQVEIEDGVLYLICYGPAPEFKPIYKILLAEPEYLLSWLEYGTQLEFKILFTSGTLASLKNQLHRLQVKPQIETTPKSATKVNDKSPSVSPLTCDDEVFLTELLADFREGL